MSRVKGSLGCRVDDGSSWGMVEMDEAVEVEGPCLKRRWKPERPEAKVGVDPDNASTRMAELILFFVCLGLRKTNKCGRHSRNLGIKHKAVFFSRALRFHEKRLRSFSTTSAAISV